MERKIQLLDCTLRDGAYVVDGKFGDAAIKGIIKKLKDAKVEIIECGWLKDLDHQNDYSYFHFPKELEPYIGEKKDGTTYVAMIDYNRYDVSKLPLYDGKSIDAIRVVFPYGKAKEGLSVAKEIKKKGYQVYLQLANTLAYSDDDLKQIAHEINKILPHAVSIVDTFGAMYEEDLERIVYVLDYELNQTIQLGFHSHNNQQLSFSLITHFLDYVRNKERSLIVDTSLCGMGRGAGNAATELVCNYLNIKRDCNYDMDIIMDAIDMYMSLYQEKYEWGYSTPYFIAGMYCCHVNNIAYLQKNHRTNARDMRNIIQSMDAEDRKKYDYDLLEEKYTLNQNRIVDDDGTMDYLRAEFKHRKILLLAPGKTIITQKQKVQNYIKENNPIVISINALNENYDCDYLFLISAVRYDYAKEVHSEQFQNTKKILLSCIKTKAEKDELIVNFSRVVKYGWEHFDNAVITCLRLMDKLHVNHVAIAGFDEFLSEYNESYADVNLPTVNPDNQWEALNAEIMSMFDDFKRHVKHTVEIEFVTDSIFDKGKDKES